MAYNAEESKAPGGNGGGIRAAEKSGLIRRRGPRKKKDVVQQSDVPQTISSRLARQTSKSSFGKYHRRVDSKISFTSTERNKRLKNTGTIADAKEEEKDE